MRTIIETDRLILRTWQPSDLAPMNDINKDPEVMKYFPALGTLEETNVHIQKIVDHYEKHGFSLYAVALKTTGLMIGFVGLMIPSFEAHFTPSVEIGWRLASQYWNKGYATEAAMAVLDYAFNVLGLKELVSFTVVGNIASRRVMEKIGLHHDVKDDFYHPKLSRDHPLCRHVLYRISKLGYAKQHNIEE
jgi:RimJ/RimL family protein N-acetyltransferase